MDTKNEGLLKNEKFNDNNLISNQNSQTNTDEERLTIPHQGNPLGESIRKEKERIAALHSETESLGIINHSCLTKCPCCQKAIPRKFNWAKSLHSNDLISYGIDLLNFNSIIKQIFTFVKYFWILISFVMVLSTLINIETYIENVKNYFVNKQYDFFLLDFLFFSNVKSEWALTVCFGGYLVVLILLFLKIMKKTKLNKKKHRMNMLNEKEIEESLFSVFVKNLPKLTDPEDFKSFVQSEYKVAIREIIMLNDYSVLENIRNKLKEFNETGNFSVHCLESMKTQIDNYADNVEHSGAAILILEENEDRLLFFREFFNLREIFYMYFKRHFIYRGRKIYFEPVPSLKMIDWNNVKYSLEKTTSNTKLQFIVSFISFTLIYAVTLGALYYVSELELVKNKILNSFLKNLVLIGLNMFLKLSIVILIESFKISDNYIKEILKSYFQAQRNTNNTVFINLLKLASTDIKVYEYDILFLIILQNIKLSFLARYNFNYIFRKIGYHVYFFKKISTQERFNDLLGENDFNFMSSFEGFKICFYLAIFVLLKSPTLAIVGTFMLYLHLLAIRFSLNRSRIKGINTNYYGFYFSYVLEKEFLLTGKFFITYAVACFFNAPIQYTVGANAIADLALDLIKMKSFYTKFWVKKKYSEVEFTRKFEDEKFVNIKIYLDEVTNLFGNLYRRLDEKKY
jgi:hypothetical protein